MSNSMFHRKDDFSLKCVYITHEVGEGISSYHPENHEISAQYHAELERSTCLKSNLVSSQTPLTLSVPSYAN